MAEQSTPAEDLVVEMLDRLRDATAEIVEPDDRVELVDPGEMNERRSLHALRIGATLKQLGYRP